MAKETYLLQLVFNEALHIQWVLFLAYTLESRLSKRNTALALTAICVLGFFLPQLFEPHSAARQFSVPIMYLVAAFLIFKGRPTRIFFCTILPEVLIVLCEILAALAVPETFSQNYDQNEFWAHASTGFATLYIALYSAMVWLAAAMIKKVKYQLTSNQWAVFLLFILSQALSISMILTMGFQSPASMGQILFVVIILALSIAADFALLRSMSDAARNTELSIKNAMLEKQLETQLAHYKALGTQYEVNRVLRHDIMHHVHTIQLLLENGRQQEATEYADQLIEDHTAVSRLGRCENPIADAFLFERIGSARKRGIAVESEIVLPSELPISNTDLIIVFGNLMDNAEEACAGCADPHISLRAHIEKGVLVIKEENSVSEGSGSGKQRHIPELERGVGMHILASVAEKYHGRFEHESSGDTFSAAVYLTLE